MDFITILETKMKRRISVALLLFTLIAFAGLAQAQTHYPAGAEGIKGPQLPPPGLYIRDYNYIYFADEFADGPPKFDLLAYIQAPRLVWITNHKILGGFYGMDSIIPFAYQDYRTEVLFERLLTSGVLEFRVRYLIVQQVKRNIYHFASFVRRHCTYRNHVLLTDGIPNKRKTYYRE